MYVCLVCMHCYVCLYAVGLLGVGERKPGYSWREDSRRAEDLSALDEQYQAGLRLNQFVQQRIAQQLQGVGSGPGGVAQG